VLGDVEIDIRPVTEPWHIGLAPEPDVTTRRYMALRKATAASEADASLSREQPSTTETVRPSAKGRRYKNSSTGIGITDGPFTEFKELIAGYVIVSAESLEEAARWAVKYIDAVGADEVDLLELVSRTMTV
jgi:YCII-related domain